MANTSPYEVRNRAKQLETNGRFTFGNADLDYDDAEQPDSQITYTITTATANGTLFNAGVALAVGGRFTQADIDAGRISYAATLRGDGTVPSDLFRFQVTDGLDGYVGGKQFTLVGTTGSGTFPAIEQANSGLTVVRGGNVVIDVLNLNYDNGAAADSDVVFRIATGPTTGTLRKDGTAIGVGATFTQADIDAGKISYQHDGSASTSASFGFSVTDSRGASISGKSFTFDIAATNTAPIEAFNTGVSVLAGTSVRITPDVLNYSDAQQRDTQLYYTVTSLPSVGTLNRQIRLGDGSFITVALKVGDRFTDADIVNRNAFSVNTIFYTAPAGTPATDTSFGFSVSDGQGGTVSGKSLAIYVETANTNPTLVSFETLGVTSGVVGTFTSGNLRAIDAEQNDSQIFYSALNVTNGTVRRDGVALAYSDRFSQQDVNDGRITFVSSNGGTSSGSLNFSVNDTVGGAAGQRTVSIVFNAPANTAPYETVNTGLQARAGQTTTITPAMLDFDDREQPDGSITYSITSLPVQGAIIWRGRTLILGDRFTQADISAGVVAFQTPAGFTGTSFGFQVIDGVGGSAQGRSFGISALSATNTSPYESINSGLKLTTGTTVTIAASNLDYDDREQSDNAIIYTITGAPTNGTVLLDGVALGVGGRFTQADLGAGRVAYRADSTPPATSSIGFQVVDGQGGYVGGKTFRVETLAPNTSPYETVNTGLRASSGQTVTIAASNLDYDDREQTDTSIFYTITTAPSAGAVLVNGVAIGLAGRFTQDDINAGRVTYRADATQPASASFGFQVTDGAGGYVGGKTVRIDLPAAPNTSPFETVNTGIRVGAGQTLTITGSNLDYDDREQADTSIFYTITSAPNLGAILRGGTVLGTGARFTQDDVTAGLIAFRNDTTAQTVVNVGFQVTDGAGGYVGGKSIRVTLAPNTSPYEVINVEHRVTTNQTITILASTLDYDDREQPDSALVYTVTRLASTGTLLRAGVSLDLGGKFTQEDVNQGLLTYRANGTPATVDTIGFQVVDGQGGYVGGKSLRFVSSSNTAPYETSNSPTSVPAGRTGAIGLAYADTDQPASMLSFSITALPVGIDVLLKGIRLGVGGQFTQLDVDNGLLTFAASTQPPAETMMTFRVSDGVGGFVDGTERFVRVNSSPFEAVNTGLQVIGGRTYVLNNLILDFDDYDQSDQQIVYRFNLDYGIFFLNGTAIGTGAFTQDDINNGRLSYHTPAVPRTAESYYFYVVDGAGGYISKPINVTNANTSPFEAVNTGLRVTSGQTVALTATNLDYDDREQADTSIFYTITGAPSAGVVLRSGVALANGGRFTQDDINNGLISYRADASQPASTTVGFQVTDGQGGYVGGKTIRIVNATTANADDGGIAHAFVADGHSAADPTLFAFALPSDDQRPAAVDPGITILA